MIRLIVAYDRKRGIAKQGFQPWYIPEDERYFTQQTRDFGGNVLAGSTTFRTFKGPLAGRHNFVLTRDQASIEGVELVHDLEDFLKQYNSGDLWVVGGANVFAQVVEMGMADEIYVTKIEADFGCNQFFPEFEAQFTLTEQSDLREQNGFIYAYYKYQKNS